MEVGQPGANCAEEERGHVMVMCWSCVGRGHSDVGAKVSHAGHVSAEWYHMLVM